MRCGDIAILLHFVSCDTFVLSCDKSAYIQMSGVFEEEMGNALNTKSAPRFEIDFNSDYNTFA